MSSERHAASARSKLGLAPIFCEPGLYLKGTRRGLILIIVALAALIAVPTGGASLNSTQVVHCKRGFHRVLHKTHPKRFVCVKNRATSKPVVKIVSHPASPSGSLEASFVFSSNSAYSFQCSLDGGAYADCGSPASYGPLAKGKHTFAVKALSGNPTIFGWTIASSGGDVRAIPAALASATTVSQAEQDLRDFFAQYHMTVAITNIQPSSLVRRWATWTALGEGDLSALKAYGVALVDEWAKYPLDWIRVTRVTGIALVTRLNVGAFNASATKRAALPDTVGEVMYYDIGYGTDDYAREVIHHEFDHLFTYNILGGAGNDPTWLSLNPPGFHYGNGGVLCYAPGNCPEGPHVVPGFVTGYATSAIEEDKAETYGYLMDTNDYHALIGWIRSDGYLAAKVAYYKQFLCRLSSTMCGDYFDSINAPVAVYSGSDTFTSHPAGWAPRRGSAAGAHSAFESATDLATS